MRCVTSTDSSTMEISRLLNVLWTMVTVFVLHSTSLSSGASLSDDSPVFEDNAVRLGGVDTVAPAAQGGDTHCDWNTHLTRFLLDETEARINLKHSMEDKINELNSQIQELKELFIKEQEAVLTSHEQKEVAFSATVASHLTGLKHDETIVFETILTNSGDAYAPDTGVFTCRIEGLYLFSATILSNVEDRIETEIVLARAGEDPESVAKLYSGGGSGRYGSGSNAVVLELESKDRVWVRVYNGLGTFVFKSWSTFNGALIRAH